LVQTEKNFGIAAMKAGMVLIPTFFSTVFPD
jgi:hypothetical protein